MNILLICPHLKVGGVPRYVINLAKGHKAHGHNVTIASFGGTWQEELNDTSINFLKIPLNTKSILSPKIYKSLRLLKEYVKVNSIDMIHANTRVAQFLAFLLSRATKVKFVSTYHGYYKAHFFRRFFKFEGNAVISISNEIKNHVVKDLKINESKVSVVYNGIDSNEYKVANSQTELRKKYGITNEPVIGIVARLVIEKNHELLIRAFKLVKEDLPQAQLIIFGKGRQEERLKELVKKLKVDNQVKFINQGDVKEVFSTFDLAVLPSTHEGFGFTIIEAQALKIPVIGSAIGGIKEVIKDGETGLIFNKFDESLLCDKIIQILNNDSERNLMINNAYNRVNDTFSLSKMSADTISVYKKVI